MPYEPGNPAGAIAGGLLAGSQVGLQYRALQDKEEQTKRQNELANFEKALEFSKMAKGTGAQSAADKALSNAGVTAGFFPEGTQFTSASPQSQDFLQTLDSGMKAVKKGAISIDDFHNIVNQSYSADIKSGNPVTGKLNYDKQVGEANTSIANSLLRSTPENMGTASANVTTPTDSQGTSLLNLPNTDPAYATPEARQGLLSYAQPDIKAKAAELSPGAIKEYQAEQDRERAKITPTQPSPGLKGWAEFSHGGDLAKAQAALGTPEGKADYMAFLKSQGEQKRPPQESVRLDKSYQYNNGELVKISKPIEDAAMRLERLKSTLGQSTPQADALVAPELLTVMAGGQGSGLRMNEAEIARIVGGRSKWETLKASINKWSLNPETANSITTDQRAQINSLVNVVSQKMQEKRGIIEKANQDLLDAEDVKTHRQIVTTARKKLLDVGTGDSANSKTADPLGIR